MKQLPYFKSISLVYAYCYMSMAIGNKGELPWPKSAKDMSWFRSITLGHAVVMGRKTFESLGKQPLLGRKNIILTRDKDYAIDPSCKDTYIAHTVEDVFELAKDSPQEIMVIGGGEIFTLFAPMATKSYATAMKKWSEDNRVVEPYEGDVLLPDVTWKNWGAGNWKMVKVYSNEDMEITVANRCLY